MKKKCKYNHSYTDSSPCGGGVCPICDYKYPLKHDITKCGHNFPPPPLAQPTKETWIDEFDRRFDLYEKCTGSACEVGYHTCNFDVKSFISAQIDKAVKEEREENIVEFQIFCGKYFNKNIEATKEFQDLVSKLSKGK